MAGLPQEYQQRMEQVLNEIGKMFKNPRLTLVVRNPDQTAQGLDADCVITNDDLNEAIRAINVRQQELAKSEAITNAPQAVS